MTSILLKLFFLGVALAFTSGCRSNDQNSSPWHQLCAEDPHDVARATPRTEHPLMQAATAAMSALPDDAQYQIPGVLGGFYRSRKREPKDFLGIMCSEYRDYPELLAAKLKLLGGLTVVREGAPQRYDPAGSVWSQLTADGYRSLVLLQRAISDFRAVSKETTKELRSFVLSECELKFIFSRYIAPHRFVLDRADVVAYEAERMKFLATALQSGACSLTEQDTLLSFRGVGYISPRDPESALMRQLGESFSRRCQGKRSLLGLMKDASLDCDKYIESPYRTRRAVADQVLSKLLQMIDQRPQDLQNRNRLLFLLEDLNHDGIGEGILEDAEEKPNSVSLAALSDRMDQFMREKKSGESEEKDQDPRELLVQALTEIVAGKPGYSAAYVDSVAPLSAYNAASIFGYNGDQNLPAYQKMLDRMTILLDRHILFYSTYLYLYNFKLLYPSTTPFLSTSADISQAHKFAVRGFASDKISARRLAWMYIFKFRRSDLIERMDNPPSQGIDLRAGWVNEASFTAHPYALEERGLDRLSEPAPSEYGELLYLGEVDPYAELLMLLETKSMSKIAGYDPKFEERLHASN